MLPAPPHPWRGGVVVGSVFVCGSVLHQINEREGDLMMVDKSVCAPASTPTTDVPRSCAWIEEESPPDSNKSKDVATTYSPL